MKEQKAVTNSVLILVANLQFLIMVGLKKKKKERKRVRVLAQSVLLLCLAFLTCHEREM